MPNMSLQERYAAIHSQIATLEQKYNRPLQSVMLLAVSKTQPSEKIHSLHALGHKDFGENYVQEALSKIAALKNLGINWHYIGTVQTNKAKDIAQNFSWVHTITRSKEIVALAKARPENLPPLQVCIQLKIDNSENKKGADFDAIDEIIATCQAHQQKITLRGLMGFAAMADNFDSQCQQFAQIQQSFIKYHQAHQMDTLCIGTSNDYAAAIKMGATMIRIGTALFGPRENKHDK